jgi:hypothetical protein
MGIFGGASKWNANGMQTFYRVKVEERPSYSYFYGKKDTYTNPTQHGTSTADLNQHESARPGHCVRRLPLSRWHCLQSRGTSARKILTILCRSVARERSGFLYTPCLEERAPKSSGETRQGGNIGQTSAASGGAASLR